MTGPGSRVRLTPRQWFRLSLWSLLLAILLVVAWCDGTAEAQGGLSLSDFDQTGLEVDVLALIEQGNHPTILWRRPPRGDALGALVDGELGLSSTNVAITEIARTTDGTDLRINDSDGAFVLATYFGAGGAGSDLTLYVQNSTNSGTGAINVDRLGGGFAHFNMDSNAAAILSNTGNGDRVIIALARLSPPAQVTGVSAVADDHDSITVTWTAANLADGYRVEWGATSGTYPDSATATSASYTITGLDEDTTYYVQVTATRTGAADGTPSAEASAATERQPPAQVTGVTAVADDHDSITVTWTAANLADGYRVEWGATSGTYPDSATATSASYTITGLDEDTTYYVQVTATRTGAADGTPSAEASAATNSMPTQPPGQVTGLSATAGGHNSIDVSWAVATNADGYVVQWDTDANFGSPAEATISSGSTTTYAITGLQEGTEYHVRAYATRVGANDGTPSATASATTTLQAPARVTGLSATVASDVSIDLSWDVALRAGGYRVEWGTTSGTYTDSITTASLSYSVTGLAPGTTHYFQVTATRTGAADGSPSAEVSATTAAAPQPGQITGLSATAISYREIRATWTAATNATGYVVQWDTADTFSDPDAADTTSAGVVIEFLKAETEYFVRVKGTRDGATDGAWSATDSATTLDSRVKVWAERFPGGQVPAQLFLGVFAGVLAGIRFKTMKSPRREAVITGAMSLGALILPMFGLANDFWVIGIALLVLLCSISAIFIARR